MRSKRIIYSLNVGDIQHVAQEELERKLSDQELQEVIDRIGDYVNWYDSIEMAIHDKINIPS
jgi:ADP-dependent phosphofructokinase/glucokinase